MKILLALITGLYGMAMSDGPQAADEPKKEQQEQKVEEQMVVTASREAQKSSDVALSVSSIDKNTIEDLQPVHPTDVMDRVPGVHVNRLGGEGHSTAIRQPISYGPVYLFMENGVPTRSTGFFNHNALYEVNIPMSSGIEVIKGPGSALHGSDAIGGVINVLSNRAPINPEAGVTLEGGEDGYKRMLLTAGNTFGEHGLRADIHVTESDGWRQFSPYERESYSLQWEKPLGQGQIRTLATYSNIEQYPAGTSALSPEAFDEDPTANFDRVSYRKVEAFRVSANYETLIGDGALSVIPYYRDNTTDLLPSWRLSYDPSTYLVENQSVGLLAKYRHDFAKWNTRFIAGMDVDYSPGSHKESALTLTRENGNYVDYQYAQSLYDYDVDFTGLSGYVQLEMDPSEKVHVSLGLRYDHMEYDYENHMGTLETGRWRRPESGRFSFENASPKLGMSYKYRPNHNLFFSYRHAFRAPSEGQLFRQGSASLTTDLDAVNALNVEVGMRGKGAHYRYEASVYRLTKTDDILTYANPVTDNNEVVNAGETSHEGIELGLDMDLGQQIQVGLSSTYARHFFDEWIVGEFANLSGNEMDAAPRWIGSVHLDYLPKWLPKAKAGLEYRRLGSYWMDQANTHRYDGYELVSLRAMVPIGKQLAARVFVHNLLDEAYAISAGYNAFRGIELSPGEPRSIHVSLQYRWQ